MINKEAIGTELIEAAIRVADEVAMKSAFPLDESELASLKRLKIVVSKYRRVCEHLWDPVGDTNYDQCLVCKETRKYEQQYFGNEVL